MKIFTIVGGVNGVGKSSFIGALKKSAIVDAGKTTADVGDNALNEIRDRIAEGASVIYETTLSKNIGMFAKEVKNLGFRIRLIYIGLDTLGESLQRIENRVLRGGHAALANDVARCFERRWETIGTVLPYCDEAVFFDNDNGFVMVAAYRNGELIKDTENSCAWIDELEVYLKANDKN